MHDDATQDHGPSYDWPAYKRQARAARRNAMRRGRGHAAAFEYAGRMRRGEIRTALLAELIEAPGHGYDLIQRLEEKSGGGWRPNPGSRDPTLPMLGGERIVGSGERDQKRG